MEAGLAYAEVSKTAPFLHSFLPVPVRGFALTVISDELRPGNVS